ncbi:T9SS type A sorting domain-containing protein [Bacteroidota bacterium]
MKKNLLLVLVLIIACSVFGQNRNLKGDGQVFWEEHFDWGNPDDPKGWTAPEGWLIEDNSADDIGYEWVWTKDSLQGPFSERDGGYILNSSTGDNGFLAIDLDNLNAFMDYIAMLYVNSSITLPPLDCSDHPSVIISLEQMFKYFNNPRMVIEVSNDDGAHWAAFDMKMGSGPGTNALNLPNDGIAHFSANLSAVAGGQADVTIKITWDGSILYFWMLDDIVISEGWDYDLKMNHWKTELVDENANESAGFYYMMPKTQIIPIGGFEASVINYGDFEMSDVRLNVTINKNHVEQFNASSEYVPFMYFGDPADTLTVDDMFTPIDFGHYDITFCMKANEEEQFSENNIKSINFNVTDSVFARTPDISEANESPWRNLYQNTHEGDLMGVEFNPVSDCEASSISVFISRSNLGVDFKYVLLEITEGEDDALEITELISSDMIWVDEDVLNQGWITLPLTLDGIGEKMKAGGRYIAAVQFWTYIEQEDIVNRADAFWIGSTKVYPGSYDKQWLYEAFTSEWTQGSNYNKMIRLNINNHENIIDGVLNNPDLFSLDQNYPNPFDKETQIGYTLANEESVLIEIKDVSGRVVLILDEGFKPAGKHTAIFNGSNLGAGIYFYTLKAGDIHQTKRMILK